MEITRDLQQVVKTIDIYKNKESLVYLFIYLRKATVKQHLMPALNLALQKHIQAPYFRVALQGSRNYLKPRTPSFR